MKFPLLAIALALACLPPLTARCDLLLAASSADTIYRYNGITATAFATDPGGPNAMDGPTALAYDASGNLLVLNEFSHNVLKFNGSTGAFLSTFIDSTALGSAGISDPNDMELGPDGKLYIMSHFNDGANNVHRFDPSSGAYLGVFASTTPPATHHQHGISFGTAGDLYQGNVDGKLIERFNGATGASMGTFASHAALTPIADLAFSSTTLYVTLAAGGGVKRFDSVSGASLPDLIPAGAGESYWGICIDGSDLYLSNTATGTLRKYNAVTGAFISDTVVGGGAFDIIPMPVPEPASAGLLLVAAALLATRRWHTI